MPKRLDNCVECGVKLTERNRYPRRNYCRPCYRPIKRATDAEQYKKHKPKRRVSMKAYYDANRERELERSRKWRQENAERMRAYRRTPQRRASQIAGQRRRRLVKHGLSLEAYDSMLENQGGGCAICGTKTPGARTGVFAIDHCHKTGRVRGLLCTNCNNGIGRFHDDPDRLQRAARYLAANVRAQT